MVQNFSAITIEALFYYVYALIDPHDNCIFYVGKGTGNRVFQHAADALEQITATDKLDTIRAIIREGLAVKYYIIRHGMEEDQAYLVESVLIDFLTFKDFSEVAKITNLVAGHHSFERGIKTAEECEMLYNCKPLDLTQICHDLLVININKTYDDRRKKKNAHPFYERENIYEATRGWWVLQVDRAKNVAYVAAEYRGVIRALFKPEIWLQNILERGDKRWAFEGFEVTDQEVLDLYLNKSVPKGPGMANPIRYFMKSTA
jgi:hypothetical protein